MEDPAFEHLTSPRLVIRRFGPDDAAALAAYRSDTEVARYQDWDCPYTEGDARKFIASLHDLAPGTPGTWFQFAVGLAPSGTLIGDAALGTSRGDASQAELGFTFAVSHQGQGYATEGLRAVLQYVFGPLAMRRLFARTDARNLRAQRLLDRLGFRQEGVQNTWFKGAWATDLLYAQLESEWREHAG